MRKSVRNNNSASVAPIWVGQCSWPTHTGVAAGARRATDELPTPKLLLFTPTLRVLWDCMGQIFAQKQRENKPYPSPCSTPINVSLAKDTSLERWARGAQAAFSAPVTCQAHTPSKPGIPDLAHPFSRATPKLGPNRTVRSTTHTRTHTSQ